MTDWLKEYKDSARNAAGGVYNTFAGMLGAPAQLASIGAQFVGGRSWKDIQVPDPMKGARESFEKMTGIPTSKPEAGHEFAFGAGRGSAVGPTAGMAALGGLASGISEKFIPSDHVLLKLLLEAGVPATASVVKNLASAVHSGSAKSFKGVANNTEIPMGKGSASGKGELLAEQEYLATHPKAADTVAQIKRAFADQSEEVLKQFTRGLKSGDRDAGSRLTAGWKEFVKAKENEFFSKSKLKFDRALGASGNKNIVDIGVVKREMDDLIKEYRDPLKGPQAEAIATELQEMRTKLFTNRITLSEANQQLEDINKMGRAGKNGTASIGIGTDTHVMRKLGDAWRDALDLSANKVDAAGNLTEDAKNVRKLIEARSHYALGAESIKSMKDSAINVFMETGATGERKLLQPESVMKKLRSMEPAEREFFVSALETADPGALDVMRKNILGTIVDKGKVAGADARSPTFANEQVLKALDESKEQLEWLIPNAAERDHFRKVVDELRMSTQSSGISGGNRSLVPQEAGGLAAMAVGKPGIQPITRGIVTKIGDTLLDKEALAKRLFSSAEQKGTVAEAATKYRPAVGNRAAAAASIVGNQGTQEVVESTQQPVVPSPGISDDELPPVTPDMYDDAPQKRSAMDKLLDGIRQVESGGNDNAVGPMTKYGTAKGPYQFIDATAKQYGLDDKTVFHEPTARAAAKKHLEYLLKKYDGDLTKAIAAYNWGEKGIDETGLDALPDETRNYVGKVHSYVLSDD